MILSACAREKAEQEARITAEIRSAGGIRLFREQGEEDRGEKLCFRSAAKSLPSAAQVFVSADPQAVFCLEALELFYHGAGVRKTRRAL